MICLCVILVRVYKQPYSLRVFHSVSSSLALGAFTYHPSVKSSRSPRLRKCSASNGITTYTHLFPLLIFLGTARTTSSLAFPPLAILVRPAAECHGCLCTLEFPLRSCQCRVCVSEGWVLCKVLLLCDCGVSAVSSPFYCDNRCHVISFLPNSIRI